MKHVISLFAEYWRLGSEINLIADQSYLEVAGRRGSWLERRRFRKQFKKALEEA